MLAVDAKRRALTDMAELAAVGHDGVKRERRALDVVRHGEGDGGLEVVEEPCGDAHVVLVGLRVLVREPAVDGEGEGEKGADGHRFAGVRRTRGAFLEERLDEVPCGAFADLDAGRSDDGGQDFLARVDAVAIADELGAVAALLGEVRGDGHHFVFLVSAHCEFSFLCFVGCWFGCLTTKDTKSFVPFVAKIGNAGDGRQQRRWRR